MTIHQKEETKQAQPCVCTVSFMPFGAGVVERVEGGACGGASRPSRPVLRSVQRWRN